MRSTLPCLALWMALEAASSGAPPASPASPVSTNFHPVALNAFYKRSLDSYKPSEAWAQVPRGMTHIDGVPFQILGIVELTGLGPARDRNFHPTRAGEIPVGRHATRLHLIHGAAYADPDGTPIAAIRLHYTRGEDRMLYLRYGVHVRNWYIESRERNATLSDPHSSVAWTGNSRPDGRGTPTRLFKTTLNNPRPDEEIRSLELLSLFGRANSVILAVTLDQAPAPAMAIAAEEVEDSDLRREMLLRTMDAGTERSRSNVIAELSVLEGDRQYNFGNYTSDWHGQILIDYPPARFQELRFRFQSSNQFLLLLNLTNDAGIYPFEIPVPLGSQGPKK